MTKRVLLAVLLIASLACERERDMRPSATPVRTEVVKRVDFTPALTLLGTIRPAHTVPITATHGGTLVHKLRFHGGFRGGEHVSYGEVVAEVVNENVVSTRERARLQLEAAKAEHERMERSYRDGVVSNADYSRTQLGVALALEAFNASLHDAAKLRVLAPATGTLIVDRELPTGTAIAAGTVIASIATGGKPIVESAVAASDRERLRPGLFVTLRGPGGWKGDGVISEVSSVLDANGTARVVIGVAQSATPAPGTGVEVDVALDPHRDVLTIPEDAIVAGEDGPAVFVAALVEGIESGMRVKRLAIQTGGRAGGRIEVMSGLRDGDRIVVSGADALVDNARVVESNVESKP